MQDDVEMTLTESQGPSLPQVLNPQKHNWQLVIALIHASYVSDGSGLGA